MHRAELSPVLLALLLICLAGVGGCGQKGALYLPDEPAASANEDGDESS